VLAAGQLARSSRLRLPGGETLSALPMDRIEQEFGASILCIHRARLQEVLLHHTGEGVVQTGRGIVGLSQDESGVTVQLADGTEERGDLLVGADGLHSAVRRLLVNDGAPQYAGYTSWRGVAPAGGRVEPGEVSETWGAGLRFGIVSIGFGEVYWFAVANAEPGQHDAPDRVHEVLVSQFGSWHAPIKELIEATPAERIIRADITDRPVLNQWAYGQAVLLGDAAHPMTPNMGQGGCQAIEDAVVLADCLQQTSDWHSAIARYQSLRVERANWFVEQSQRLGQIAQWSHPVARWARDLLLRATPPSAAVKQLRTAMRFAL
jgi:2-polyprenyl-6-methoxyphenol hydroxylase-like FAD-dependent oxidoreductase